MTIIKSKLEIISQIQLDVKSKEDICLIADILERNKTVEFSHGDTIFSLEWNKSDKEIEHFIYGALQYRLGCGNGMGAWSFDPDANGIDQEAVDNGILGGRLADMVELIINSACYEHYQGPFS